MLKKALPRISCLLVLIISAFPALGDGLPLKDGRYVGDTLVFKLTDMQKRIADQFWVCHLENFRKMNAYTPYVFTLTSSQASKVHGAVGYTPKYFMIYETRKGFNDSGPHWNLALRFSENEIEIPLDLLVSDSDAKILHNTQGWLPENPCFKPIQALPSIVWVV